MMWPLLLTSIVALAVVFERLIFVIRERMSREPGLVERIFAPVEQGDLGAPAAITGGIARALIAKAFGLVITKVVIQTQPTRAAP